jgi:predicted nucleotidyltransferase
VLGFSCSIGSGPFRRKRGAWCWESQHITIGAVQPAMRLIRPQTPTGYVDYRWRHQEPADVLMGSRTAAALLAFLTLHPGRPVELAEAEWRTGSSHESVHRTVARLVSAGVLEGGPSGARRTILLPPSPQAAEMRRLLLAYGPVGSRLRWFASLQEGAITQALVYGSIAAGTEHASSDLDILTVGRASAGAVLRALGDLSDVIGRDIHVVAYTGERFAADLALGLSFPRNVTSSPLIPILGDFPATAAHAA